mmetsp:Transcript_11172/g.28310  ORF Transcript_11172/g.28310 Transcript_11172/m.28310 type:complete len:87 (+) Transcript_11172:156-416(+)
MQSMDVKSQKDNNFVKIKPIQITRFRRKIRKQQVIGVLQSSRRLTDQRRQSPELVGKPDHSDVFRRNDNFRVSQLDLEREILVIPK